ncbi:hypothetical protein CHLRE_04g217962v5 [Chlamydomonas reinhardtii]|uniref:Uncharacterized protein n=1 Tax=Chlamydomonas reinhardtii TaxID=3055 RepID=A8JJF2_CHLRE|nr:uncharacterized protein CHLRE_04g217962v5 [Chlamydomonas reinhardtii]PNW83864.1 hypothetical protein CHLRE_04g217962v5 [Chlamydomonas reinhardtii]|eukprot:XP_001698123.1 low-CO2-inducible protein [Chlamydomonas reinhardtii]
MALHGHEDEELLDYDEDDFETAGEPSSEPPAVDANGDTDIADVKEEENAAAGPSTSSVVLSCRCYHCGQPVSVALIAAETAATTGGNGGAAGGSDGRVATGSRELAAGAAPQPAADLNGAASPPATDDAGMETEEEDNRPTPAPKRQKRADGSGPSAAVTEIADGSLPCPPRTSDETKFGVSEAILKARKVDGLCFVCGKSGHSVKAHVGYDNWQTVVRKGGQGGRGRGRGGGQGGGRGNKGGRGGAAGKAGGRK